ncbi:hypothetical protein ACFQ5D_22735 [Paenibacillus farraposensis]|uniref:Uncharacterized protein n=1 Tax=Paenibacillus farraposensis TaxID=2807095 RepID=A0ABW4DLD2_9BACL|nr:hypothetical protein [Paenibacillus farraposensis]MCC3379196.1 hypothetical protein [Paenibacillus farraposensis]
MTFNCFCIDEGCKKSNFFQSKKISEVWEFVVERKSLYHEVLVLNEKEEVVIHASNGWIDYPKRWSILDLEHTFVENKKREFNADEFLNAAQGLGFLLDGNAPQSIQEVDSLIMSLYVE